MTGSFHVLSEFFAGASPSDFGLLSAFGTRPSTFGIQRAVTNKGCFRNMPVTIGAYGFAHENKINYDKSVNRSKSHGPSHHDRRSSPGGNARAGCFTGGL